MSSSHFDIRGEISKRKCKKQISSPLNSSSAPETMGVQRTREADENVFPHEREPSVSDNPALFLPDTQYFRNIHMGHTRFQEYSYGTNQISGIFRNPNKLCFHFPTQSQKWTLSNPKLNAWVLAWKGECEQKEEMKRHFVSFSSFFLFPLQITSWKKTTKNNNNFGTLSESHLPSSLNLPSLF